MGTMMGRTMTTMMRSCTRSCFCSGYLGEARSKKYYVQLAKTVIHAALKVRLLTM
jgi:hypothetical protein